MNRNCIILLVLFSLIIVTSIDAPSSDPPLTLTEQQSGKGEGHGITDIDGVKRELSEIKKKVEKPPKDFWDKLGTTSGLISGILVALIVFYATQVYTREQRKAEENRKERELKNLQMQTVEKFFPHLSSGDESKKEAAFLAIASLGIEELATKIALIFGGTGAKSALSKIASVSVSDPKTIKSAESALSELFAMIRPSVVRIESEGNLVANGFFINSKGLIITTAHVVGLLKDGKIQVETASKDKVPAVIKRIQEDQDLALLQAQLQGPVVPLKLTATTMPIESWVGSQVIALGHSAAGTWLATVGTISVTIAVGDRWFDEYPIGVAMATSPIFSGAPVLDAQGGFFGLVQECDPSHELTQVIPYSIVRSVFRQELTDGA